MAYRVGLDNIDVTDDIVLDADGDNITFKAGGDDSTGLDFQQSGGGNWTFGPTTSNKNLLFKVNVGGTPTDAMILKGSNGYLGIGVSDPDTHLEVAGMVHISGEQGSAPSAPSDGDGGILYTKADGKVYWRSNELSETDLTAAGGSGADVGSSNTFTAGQAISKDQDSEFVALVLKNESDANDTTGEVSLRFDLEDTGGTAVDSAKIAAKKEQAFTATASTQDSSMVFSTSLNGTLTERMTLTSDGKLGVGVTDPDSGLEVLNTSTQAKFSYDADSFATITVADGGGTTIATSESGDLTLDPGGGDIFFDRSGNRVRFEMSTGASFMQNDVEGGDLGFKVNTDNGTITEMARFDATGDGSFLMAGSVPIQFRDTATHISSTSANVLDITAPTTDINATTKVVVDTPIVEFEDDGTILKFGDDSEITLTHIHDTGLTLASSAASTPVFEIQNTHNGDTAGILKFNNTRGGNDAADGDDLGSIQFWGNDDGTPSVQQYAGILAEISDASSGAEGGKLSLQVAEHDGTVTTGLLLQDGDDNGEIDVTIGAGANSLTTFAGETFFTGIPRLETASITPTGSSTTITPSTPVIFLDLSSASLSNGLGGYHEATMATSSATDGDMVHIIVTGVSSSIMFIFSDNASNGDGNLLCTGNPFAGGKGLGIAAGANSLGAAFTLVYVGSASKWAVVGVNGIAAF